MAKKVKIGDVRPIYQQVGWEVCKETAEDPKDEVWIPCERQSEAEILSLALASPKKEKKKDDEDD